MCDYAQAQYENGAWDPWAPKATEEPPTEDMAAPTDLTADPAAPTADEIPATPTDLIFIDQPGS